MNTGPEILDEDPHNDKKVGTEAAIQAVNYEGRLCNRKSQYSSCIDPRNEQQNVDPTEEITSQPNETQISKAVKKRGFDASKRCRLDCLPEYILHDIFSRLPIRQLLRAQLTSLGWDHTISSSEDFHRIYDERNKESWIALANDPQNPHGFQLFNNSNNWVFFQVSCLADQGTCWLLQGAADGVMLLVSSEGKMVAANILTNRFRLLPDTKVSTRLWLQSCLKKKLWSSNSTSRCVQPPMYIEIVVDQNAEATRKAFRVIVWGELRSNQVHCLVYTSTTDTWSVRLCLHIDCSLFRRPFVSTMDGNNTIYLTSLNPYVMARYNIESGLFRIIGPVRQRRVLGGSTERNILMVVDSNRIFLLNVMGSIGLNATHFSTLSLWQANRSPWTWELQTSLIMPYPSEKVAAAYDNGKHSVTIIPMVQGATMIILNLNTKDWRLWDENTQWRSLDGNARQLHNSAASWRAFHLKLKFCTAV